MPAVERHGFLNPKLEYSMNPLSALSDDPSVCDSMKRVLCEVEVPFVMTFQERLFLFSMLDLTVQSVRSGASEVLQCFAIEPSAVPVLEALHGKFVQSFHKGGIPFEEARIQFPDDYPTQS
jgi:hypothetical protein